MVAAFLPIVSGCIHLQPGLHRVSLVHFDFVFIGNVHQLVMCHFADTSLSKTDNFDRTADHITLMVDFFVVVIVVEIG